MWILDYDSLGACIDGSRPGFYLKKGEKDKLLITFLNKEDYSEKILKKEDLVDQLFEKLRKS